MKNIINGMIIDHKENLDILRLAIFVGVSMTAILAKLAYNIIAPLV